MSTAAFVTVDGDSIPLGLLFEEHPGVVIEVERIIPTETSIVPFFWIRGEDPAGVAATLESHPEIADVTVLDELEGQLLIRVEWTPDVDGIFSDIRDAELTLLSAQGVDGNWYIELRASKFGDLAMFRERCVERGIDIRVDVVHETFREDPVKRYGLTEAQYEALTLAYEHGYYDSPRLVTLQELADELDITGQSLGSRLQRGVKHLIEHTIVGNPLQPESDRSP